MPGILKSIFKKSRIQSDNNRQETEKQPRDVKTRIKARQEKAYTGKIDGKNFQMSKDQKILSLLKENDQSDQTELLRAYQLQLPEDIKDGDEYKSLNEEGKSAVCDLGKEYQGLYLVKNKLNQGGAESAKLYANYKGEMRALAFENDQVYVLGKNKEGEAEKIPLNISLENGKINSEKLADIAKKIQTAGKERGAELAQEPKTGRKFVEQIEALKELDVVEVPQAAPTPIGASMADLANALPKTQSNNQFPEYTALLTNLHLIGENFKKTFDKKSAKDFQTLAEKLLQPEPNLEEVTKAKEQFVQSFESNGNLEKALLPALQKSFHTYANAIYRDRITTLPAMKEGAEGVLPRNYIRALNELLKAVTEDAKKNRKITYLSNFDNASTQQLDAQKSNLPQFRKWQTIAKNVEKLANESDIAKQTVFFTQLLESLQTALKNTPVTATTATLTRSRSINLDSA